MYKKSALFLISFLISLFLVSAVFADNWDITLTSTNELEPMSFGMNSAATDGFDAAFDAYIQTPQPDKVIMSLDTTYATSIKEDNYTKNWTLSISVPASQTADLSWNTSSLPNTVNLTLYNSTDLINMNDVNSLDLSEGTHEFTILASEQAPPSTPAAYLVISEIMQNPSGSDTDKEWFEIYNPDAFDVDLNGWTIKDEGTNTHTISTSINITPNQYFVLCVNDNASENGGVTCDYDYPSSFSLGNTDDEIILLDNLDLEVDRVVYDDVTFPDPDGASMELVDVNLDNNNGSNWAESTSVFGDGDKGTPGAVYTPNIPPTQPVLNSPADTISLNVDDVTLNLTVQDDDNDTMWCYLYGDNETDPQTVIHTFINVQNEDLTFEWTNLDDGTYYWKAYCNDGIDDSPNSTIYSFQVDTISPTINQLNKTPEPSYNDDDVTLTANITGDIDSVWISIRNNDGNWTDSEATPAAGDIYTYNIDRAYFENQDLIEYRWYANDSLGNTAQSSLQEFTVQNRAPNQTTNISVQTLNEDENITFNIAGNFIDWDGDNLTYDVSVHPSYLIGTLNETTGEVFLEPIPDYNGNDSMVFEVRDPFGGSVISNEVIFIIENTNDAPELDSISDKSFREGINSTFTLTADDIDPTNDTLTFTSNASFTGLFNLDSATGEFWFEPAYEDVGVHDVLFTVTDNHGLSDNQTVEITVESLLN